MKMNPHIRRQNRRMPHILGLSKRNVRIARAVNKNMDAGVRKEPGSRHRADPEHGPFSIITSFKQYGILGAKNALQHLLDDCRSDYGNPNKTKLQIAIERSKIRRERRRRFRSKKL